MLTLRHNELVSDGLLGQLSVILIEGLVKTYFDEPLLTEDAARSTDVSDLQRWLEFTAPALENGEDCVFIKFVFIKFTYIQYACVVTLTP